MAKDLTGSVSDDNGGGIGLKVMTVAMTFAAGWLAQKLLATIWEKATKKTVPTDLDDEEITIVQAVLFAAVSGGIAVLARRMAHRGAANVAARYNKNALEADAAVEV
jgi:hypothetical protein